MVDKKSNRGIESMNTKTVLTLLYLVYKTAEESVHDGIKYIIRRLK
jgi:hypothetical protein